MKAVISTLLAGALLALCGMAQTAKQAPKAPSGPESAVRARAKQFFTLQQEGKFRAAESCVCDDTKDYFYNLEKKPPQSVELGKVSFDKGKSTAELLVTVIADVPTMHGNMRLVAPLTTRWRLENKQWCYYLPLKQQTSHKTPFGELNSGKQGAKPLSPGGDKTGFIPVTPEAVQSGVAISAERVVFYANKPAAAEIELTNSLPGGVDITTKGPLPPGIKVTITPKQVAAKGVAKVRFAYTPEAKLPNSEYEIKLLVEPTLQEFDISIVFRLPEEMKQQAPQPAPPAAIRQ